MFTQEDRNYVKALLIDRQARLTKALRREAKLVKALHSVSPHSAFSDCVEVQNELSQVTSVLDKIRKVESPSN
jgi:hypothetical protein